jgi:S1-C subfamily serine protease
VAQHQLTTHNGPVTDAGVGTQSLNPRDVIVPIFGLRENGRPGPFLGTGSIVGDGSILLTANHVLKPWSGPLGIMVTGDLSRAYPITLIDREPRHDLALLRITDYRPPRPLKLEFDLAAVSENTSLMT